MGNRGACAHLEVLHRCVSPDEEGQLRRHPLVRLAEGRYIRLILCVIVDPDCKIADLQAKITVDLTAHALRRAPCIQQATLSRRLCPTMATSHKAQQ